MTSGIKVGSINGLNGNGVTLEGSYHYQNDITFNGTSVKSVLGGAIPSGVVSGFAYNGTNGTTVSIGAGTAYLRSSTSAYPELKSFSAATSLTVPAGTQYLYVTYAGEHLFTSDYNSVDGNTAVVIHYFYNNTNWGRIYQSDMRSASPGVGTVIQRQFASMGPRKLISGMVMTTTNRVINVSSIKYWDGHSVVTIPDFSTTTAAISGTWYTDTGYVFETQSQFDNANYNIGGTTGRTAIPSGQYSFYDIYIILFQEAFLWYAGYATSTYVNARAAELAGRPNVPSMITSNPLHFYLGRIIFLKDASSAALVISNRANSSGHDSHAQFVDLKSNDDHIQYLRLGGRTGKEELVLLNAGSANVSLAFGAPNYGIIRKASTTAVYSNIISCQHSSQNYNTIEIASSNGRSASMMFGTTYHATSADKYNSFAGCPAQMIMWDGDTSMFISANSTGNPSAGALITGTANYFHLVYNSGSSRYEVRSPVARATTISNNLFDLQIDANGVIGYSSSCAEQKEIVSDLDYEALIYGIPIKSYVKKIRVVAEDGSVSWENNPDTDSRFVEVGAVAEELETLNYDLYQNIINYEDIANPLETQIVDGKYVPATKKESVWKPCGIKYSQLTCSLVYCIQKLRERVAALETKTAALEKVAGTSSSSEEPIFRGTLDAETRGVEIAGSAKVSNCSVDVIIKNGSDCVRKREYYAIDVDSVQLLSSAFETSNTTRLSASGLELSGGKLVYPITSQLSGTKYSIRVEFNDLEM